MVSNASVTRLFEEQVAATPGQVALMHGDIQWTYHSLNARANQFARYLRRYGVAQETRVVACGERCPDLIAMLLGVLKAGGAYVPIEPTFPPGRITDIVASTRASVVVTWRRQEELGASIGEVIVVPEHEERIVQEDSSNLESEADPESIFAVLFTSGTTGKPKGILMRNGGVANLLTGMGTQFPFQQNDTFLLHRSFTIVGSIWEYFGTLLYGMRGTILSGDDSRDPATIWERLLKHRVTHIILSPTLGNAIIKYGERYGLHSHSLRFGVVGGEPASKRTIAGWLGRFPSGKFYNCYGITETMYLTFFDTSLLQPEEERVPAGSEFMKATVRILNEDLECVDEGSAGEVCISTACLSRGYLDDAPLTAQHYIPDAWAATSGSRLYRTGDLGCRRADGTLELKGRCDRQVKIRGFRVELDEVEAVVRRVARARNVAVLLSADSDGKQKLIAYLETDAAIAAEALRQELRSHIPEHMIPSHFVQVTSLPVNVGGKLDRAALAQPVLQKSTQTA
ncbi:MAG TPA: amino acid adenylation domain-containing protein [Candidatus Angelobacter sp.]|jgi:tyrocidine synthetase-3